MAGKPFTFYTRKRKDGKKIIYIKFKRPDGSYTTGMSTGHTSRNQAEAWAFQYMIKHGPFLPSQDITFDVFTQNFFDWEGSWAIDRRARGLRISRRHCREREDLLKNHILPFFKDFQVKDINRAKIKDFRNNLYTQGYSGSSINKNLSALRAILEVAEEKEVLQAIPRIDRAAERPKEKGILTIEEVREIFSIEWYTKASHRHPAKINFMGKAGNRLAASTGLRLSEIQGLTHKDVHINDRYISINRSWDARLLILNATTKSGRSRNILLPASVIDDIVTLIRNHPAPGPDAFVFFSEKKPEQPAAQRVFTDALSKALHDIGITEEERRERNITFHSWRHFMNSLMLNSKIPVEKIRMITGHLSAEMVNHYYHVNIGDMGDIKQLQESLFLPEGGHDEIH